jgi:hypothetical protein
MNIYASLFGLFVLVAVEVRSADAQGGGPTVWSASPYSTLEIPAVVQSNQLKSNSAFALRRVHQVQTPDSTNYVTGVRWFDLDQRLLNEP